MQLQEKIDESNNNAHVASERLIENYYRTNNPQAIALVEAIIMGFIQNDLSFDSNGEDKSLIVAICRTQDKTLEDLAKLLNVKLSINTTATLETNIMRVLQSLGYPIKDEDIYLDTRRS